MYLKRLEMQGFKSFADKTILEFRPGITGVIGPNGSGKSNISDAIRWILGEQSMKSLRGNKTQDIIFAGTQNRKSLGFAEASLVFDNTDGTLPIEFSEVTITRKIYRSGETGYYINKAPCRLKDVIELFMDTGIGRDGYSIIGQGKVDEILSNKSEDRRHIFEEAAGIVKYRARKEETEKKLEQTKLNLLRINDIIIEIEGNLEPLQLQSDKAKKYLNLKEELKNIEIGLFLYNIDKYKKDLEALVQDEEIMKSTLNQEEGKLEKIKILKEELKYSKSHEWIALDGDTAVVGLTDYAQSELGDLVFVNLPEVGDTVEAGEVFGDVESVKAVSDVYSPVTGEVTEINEELLDSPELINDDAYEAWFIKVKDVSATEELLTAEEYKAFVESKQE